MTAACTALNRRRTVWARKCRLLSKVGNMKKLILLCSIGLSAVAWSQNVTSAMKSSSDLAVVVNTKNATTEITTAELGLILSGERRFWGGKAPVQLILLQPGTREFDEPVSKLLKMKP